MSQQARQPGNEMFTRQVVNLGELLQYQEKGVVRQALMKQKTGTVTAFAFDENEGLSEHTAPFEAMAYVLEGEGEITISGRPFVVEAGEMIILPAGEPHTLRAIKRFKMLLVMLRD